MSLLTQASLVITPNGVKEGTLYSVIPSDGSGDMSVVRATTATRVNSAGLVELVPRNLLQYSQQIGTSPWFYTATDVNLASTSVISPSGSADSIRVTNTIANGSVSFYQLFSSLLSTYTYTIYVKKDTNRYFGLTLTSGASTQNRYAVYFDLQNGVVHQVFNTSIPLTNTNNSIESVGNGWYRCRITATCETAVYVVGQSTNNGTLAFSINGDLTNATTGIIYAWGAQAEQGSTATEYFPTTDRLNIPRLDYSNGTCPSLLVEPQRTNLLTYSSSFDNVIWGAPSNVIANTVISPSGIQDADTLTGGLYRLQVFSATTYVFSFYAKKNAQSTFSMRVDAPTNQTFNFNLDTGTADNGATMVSVGNGWYRCLMPFTSGFSGTGVFYPNVAGNNFYIWGAQLEAGSYPTSYIPTTSASVTRNADVVSKTGISSLIGQTEGTLFCDSYINISNNQLSGLLGITNTVENFIYLFYIGNQVYQQTNIGGALNTTYIATIPSSGRYKIALAYKSNDFSFYINGTQVWQTTTASVPTCSDVSFQNATLGINSGSNINANILWKTRLTNTQLAQLTTI